MYDLRIVSDCLTTHSCVFLWTSLKGAMGHLGNTTPFTCDVFVWPRVGWCSGSEHQSSLSRGSPLFQSGITGGANWLIWYGGFQKASERERGGEAKEKRRRRKKPSLEFGQEEGHSDTLAVFHGERGSHDSLMSYTMGLTGKSSSMSLSIQRALSLSVPYTLWETSDCTPV